MVAVEQAFKLDLAQQDAVLGLTGGGAGGIDVAASQGIEGGGVAEAVSLAEG